MNPERRLPVVLFALLAVSFCVLAEEDKPQDRGILERVGSTLVEVPVHVVAKGEPVRGLTVDDFVILDEGKRQQILGFDVMDLELTAGSDAPQLGPEVSVAARRRFLLLFDVSFSDARSVSRAQEVVQDWVQTALHPWDLVAVAVYNAASGAKMVLNFTSDREQVLLAVNTLGSLNTYLRASDPLALELGLPEAQRYASEDPSAVKTPMNKHNTTVGEQQVIDAMEFVYRGAYAPINRQGRRQSVSEMARSLAGLVHLMRHLGGRKHVVFLSEGFEDDLLFAVDASEEINELNRLRESGQIWQVESSKRFGSTVAQGWINEMVEAFRRADCSIQAIDISTLDSLGESRVMSTGGAQSLFYLANETGGEMYRNFADLGMAMSTLMKKTSVTYLLTFSPNRLEPDGSYHKLKVKLRKKIPGVTLTYRPGYYAPAEGARPTPDELRLHAATQVMQGLEGGDLATSVLATPFRSDGSTAYVPVLIEIAGADVPDPVGNDPVSLEIYAYAVAEDGTIGDFFTQQINIDTSILGDRLRSSGVKYFGDLDLDPGRYSLRVLVREKSLGLFSSRVVQLEVPDFQGDEIHVLPPLFPDERGAWILARGTAAAGGDGGRSFPFMAGGEPYLPAATPVVSAHGPSHLRLVAYHLGEGPISAEASLVHTSGKIMDRSRLNLWEQYDHGSGGGSVYLASFEPGDLEAGRYVLSIKMTNPATGLSGSNSIPLLVVEKGRETESSEAPGPTRPQTDGTRWSRLGWSAPRR